MIHTCFGEYCLITNSWDCPNRSDREHADKRTLQEIEAAQLQVRMMKKCAEEEFTKKLKESLGL